MSAGRFLIIGDIALTGASLVLVAFGAWVMLAFALLTAASAYMLINAGAWDA